MLKKLNYIIIGAGSAGCVLANRLSADKNNQVVLLEAGGNDSNPWIHVPVGYFKTMHNPSTDWCYKTKPDPGIDNRSLQWPRGKVLGGSSSLNGLLYVRGQPEDYDNWDRLGNQGWSYKDVLPYFKKSENQSRGADYYHGVDGELRVSDLRLRRPIAEKFILAAQEIGIPFNQDYNGAEQAGVSYFQQTAYNGLRYSSAKAFLTPIKNKRSNLQVITKAQVSKILFSGKRAIGVEYYHNKSKHKLFCDGEVILAAGAIGSPQLLQLSGVGDESLLQAHNIPVVHMLAGVGQNLQDHLQIRLVFKTNLDTLNDELNKWWKKLRVGMQYVCTRTGPLTLAASQITIFTNTQQDSRPDIQFHMQPLSADKPGDGVHNFSGFTMSVCQLRPESRGSVMINSSSPFEHPTITPNYLATDYDIKIAVAGIKKARAIAQAPALKPYILSEFVPGANFQSEEDLIKVARKFSQTIYHPVGTCKMGHDAMAVVDDKLKVHGVENLRVVDASIMPEIVSGNTNAPTIMIAEVAADFILGTNT